MDDVLPTPPVAPVDVATERARTGHAPAAWHGWHPLNAAGAALPAPGVLDTVVEHLQLEARMGGYEAAAAVRQRLDGVYASAAALLGAVPDDIALVESATVGWRRVVDGLRLGAGDRVLATRATYVSSALHLLELTRAGVEVELLPVTASGTTDLEAVERALRTPATLLAATHIPTSSGVVEDVAALGRLAAASGVPYLVDATQSVGHVPVDVAAIGCDALVTTGRKFLRAPRGTGVLFVGPALRARLRPASPDVRGARWSGEREYELDDSARRFESWEAAHALRLGLGVALAEALAVGPERVARHVGDLAATLRRRLAAEVPGVRIADLPGASSGIVTFVRTGESAQETLGRLKAAGCDAVVVPASHGVWDLAPRGLDAVVRVSVHVYNGADDVDAVVEALRVPAERRPRVAPAPSQSTADVLVIGGGIHGRSAAWELARSGRSVTLLERFAPGHARGSSHGATRMIRRAYPSPVWDDLVDRAYTAWAALEDAAGERLLTVTGGLYARPADAPGGLRGPGCSLLDAAAARAVAPALALPEDVVAVHDPAAGVLDAPAALAALARLGAASGVSAHTAAAVLGLDADDAGVTVHTPRGTHRAEHVVVCAGPWTGTLVPELAELLRVVRIVNVHLRAPDPARVAPPALGVFSVDVPGVGLLYGIPAFGGRGLKVGLDHGPLDDPDRPAAPVSAAEAGVLADLVRRWVPAGAGPVEDALACRYTMAPRNRFAIGSVPARERVLVAAACSGHGFKFGPAIGAALADLVAGVPRPDLDFLAPAAMLTGDEPPAPVAVA